MEPLQAVLPFAMSKAASPEMLQAFRRVVCAAVDAGHSNIEIDVDDVGVLDSSAISALLAILRKARERRTYVALRASRKSILDTLRVTGLDQVFTVVAAAHDRCSTQWHRPLAPRPGRRA
jgi:anti-anti-sigma factor